MASPALQLLTSTAIFSAPLVLGGLGALTSERSGVINIGIEGKMLFAAWAAALGGWASGNPIVGLLAAVLAATVISQAHWALTQAFRIDHVISGMGLNAIAAGATSMLNKSVLSRFAGTRAAALPLPFFWVGAVLATVAVAYVLNQTRGGLRLSAVGHDPEKARQVGLKPVAVRFRALLATGLLAGLAGSLLVSNAGGFTDNMTSGRGYIALAAVILGGWRPWPTLAACVLFGFADALQLQLQGTGLWGAALPPEAWQCLPYVATLVALMAKWGGTKAPAGLGRF
ncbi:MAG: ABC transporter permease [Armatimonadetes bacterium]|nr:ABC transporter permease [Armatimonadota bacterium]